jgi:3-oxoacyl-[acyl-carrier protein] reductase
MPSTPNTNSSRSLPGQLLGRVALVTGAGRGVGAALARKLAAAGASVVVADLDEDPARGVAAEIEAEGGSASVFPGDVREADYGDRVIAHMLDRFGGVDILINNAGYVWNSSIHKTSDEQFQAMLDVHTVAPFRILRAASRFLRDASHRDSEAGNPVHRKVVNVSSVSGFYGGATQIGYAAAKAALIGVTRTLAKEWGPYRVNVNCVAFGLIETRLTQVWEGDQVATIDVGGGTYRVGFDSASRDDVVKHIPLGRPGTPEEAAGAVYLFCTPESDYISGELLVAGGGLLSL